MSKKLLSNAQLEALLGTYRVAVDNSETAVGAMVGASRRRAVALQDNLDTGLWTVLAKTLGFHRRAQLAWSGAAGCALALVIGISLGATDILPTFDEQAFAVDFDNVLGGGAIGAGEDAAL